jgi:hypothetical protein
MAALPFDIDPFCLPGVNILRIFAAAPSAHDRFTVDGHNGRRLG